MGGLLIFCSVGRAFIFGLFGSVSVALSCFWFSKLSTGIIAVKSSGMSRMRQPLSSKYKLVAAAELSSIKPNSKQRKADLPKVRAGGPLGHWAIRSLVHWPTRSGEGSCNEPLRNNAEPVSGNTSEARQAGSQATAQSEAQTSEALQQTQVMQGLVRALAIGLCAAVSNARVAMGMVGRGSLPWPNIRRFEARRWTLS
jgi:hypothetical protein